MKRLLASLLVCFSTTAFAQTTIYAIDIPGLHEKGGQGIYDKIINKALVAPGKASLQVLPPARVEKNFANCNNCCWSPANLNTEFYDFGSDVVETEAMGVAKIYIFSAPGKPAYASLDELQGKRVGIRNGMPYGKSFDAANLDAQSTSVISANISKLENDRIDAMVAYVPDAYDAFESLGKAPFPHDKDKPVAVHPDAMVCRGAPADLVETFNTYLTK